MAEHTPTPWSFEDIIGSGEQIHSKTKYMPTVCFFPWHGGPEHHTEEGKQWVAVIQANAAFIVRACNAHEKLVEACKAVLLDHVFEEPPQPEWDDPHSIAMRLVREALEAAEKL